MGIEERRERERQEVRQRILDAARGLLLEGGMDAVTMRAVAARAEYAHTVIYTHFGDKDGLLRALMHNDFRQFRDAIAPVLAIDDPIHRLVELARSYVRFGLAHPDHYRFMFMTPVDAEAVARADCGGIVPGDPGDDAYAVLMACVEHAISRGALREDLTDPALVAQVLWSGVHGLVALQLTHRADEWFQWRSLHALSEELIFSSTRGVARRPEDVPLPRPEPVQGARA